MNKLLTVAGAVALSVAFATAVPQSTSAATTDAADKAGKNCTVATIGTKNGAHGADAKFVIKDGVAKTQFEVKGGPNCQKEVKLKLYYTLKEGGLPREAQQKILTKGGTYGVGKHHLAVKLPGACFYQLDLVNESNKQANGKFQMLGFVLGGEKSCIKTPPTDQPPTDQPPTDQPPVVEPPVVEPPVVDTPVEPVASETTEELAQTGPASTAALFAAVSAIAGIGYNIYSRRRNNA